MDIVDFVDDNESIVEKFLDILDFEFAFLRGRIRGGRRHHDVLNYIIGEL